LKLTENVRLIACRHEDGADSGGPNRRCARVESIGICTAKDVPKAGICMGDLGRLSAKSKLAGHHVVALMRQKGLQRGLSNHEKT
jgi:hypothetical protein